MKQIIKGYYDWESIIRDWGKLTNSQKDDAEVYLNHNGSLCYVGEKYNFKTDYQLERLGNNKYCHTCWMTFSVHRFGESKIINNGVLNRKAWNSAVKAFMRHWNEKHKTTPSV